MPKSGYTTDQRTREKSKSLYLQFNTDWDFSMPVHTSVGARYETTEVTSTALVPIATSYTWLSQNEFAVGWLDGVPRVTTPDLICVMDSVSGDAIGTETLRYGQRVSVVALPAPPVLLTPKGLEHVGPRAFGYDLEFTSVFS